MSKIVGKGYTFDDLALLPVYNNVDSRLEPNFKTYLTKQTELKIPIVNAPMDTVISFELAELLHERGTVPIFARGNELSHYENIKEKFPTKSCVVSVGLDVHKNKSIIDLGFNTVLIDVANGHTKQMEKAINELKNFEPSLQVIAGNVCTGRGYYDLVNWGADCVRVGIGPGAACTTRIVTGVGVPQMSAILDIVEEKEKMKVPFIADGGISSSRELCLALAAGADCVMAGKIFALTEESGAQKAGGIDVYGDISDDTRYAKFRGQASRDYQEDHYGGVRKGTVPEGVDFWAPVTGSANDIIDNMLGGLRSSMTYLGARSISEYREKARFIEVTNTYMKESKPREK